MNKKIVVTGGEGRFAKVLKKQNLSLNILYPTKKKLNILSEKSIEKYLNKNKPKYLIHCAGLSRPMSLHERQVVKSINLNIIGTSNIVKVCSKLKLKLIYFSTGYVYKGTKGNYKESDSVNPINSYAWSKLGGECAVKLYKNSLILRITMCEKPFMHKKAFSDVKTNFMFHEDLAKILPKLLNKKGIINVGGKTQTVYNFAKKFNPNLKKISAKKLLRNKFPLNPSMNINKLKKIIK